MTTDDQRTWDWSERCPLCGTPEVLEVWTDPDAPESGRALIHCTSCGETSPASDITQAVKRLLVARWRIKLDLSVAFTPPKGGDNA